MGLRDAFRPKWKHPDPAVREKAVARLEDQEALLKVAENESELEKIRLLALEKLESENLVGFADWSPDGKLARAAIDRLSQAELGEFVRTSRSIAEDAFARLDYVLDRLEDQTVIDSLVENWSGDPDVYVMLVKKKVREESWLYRIAAENRESRIVSAVLAEIRNVDLIAKLIALYSQPAEKGQEHSNEKCRDLASERMVDCLLARLEDADPARFASLAARLLAVVTADYPLWTARAAGEIIRMRDASGWSSPELEQALNMALMLVMGDIRRRTMETRYCPTRFASDDGIFSIALFGSLAVRLIGEIEEIAADSDVDIDLRLLLFAALACLADDPTPWLERLLAPMHAANTGYGGPGGGGIAEVINYVDAWSAFSPAGRASDSLKRALRLRPEKIVPALEALRNRYPEEVADLVDRGA